MEQIIEPSPNFNFTKVVCSPPNNIGGSYFTKLFYNNKPIYIQTPKSLTKQGIISGKKINYTDLLFSSEDTLFIQWMEDLEERCQTLIHENSNKWFETPLDKSDIENAFNSTIKIYKSGKNYLIRTNLKSNIRIYDETNNNIAQDKLSNGQYIISILEIQGIKFTARSFQIIIEMKQAMVVSPDPFLDECFIKTPFKGSKRLNIDETLSHKYVDKEKEQKTNKEEDIEEEEEEEKKEDPVISNTIANTSLEEMSDINKIPQAQMSNKHFSKDIEESFNNKDLVNTDLKTSVLKPPDLKPLDLKPPDLKPLDLKPLDLKPPDIKNITFSIDDSFPAEYELELPSETEVFTLKKRNEVYYDLYKRAREKAKKAKKEAMLAYLNAKQIKHSHMLDLEDEDSESDLESNIENLGQY